MLSTLNLSNLNLPVAQLNLDAGLLDEAANRVEDAAEGLVVVLLRSGGVLVLGADAAQDCAQVDSHCP